ncbi:TPA: hypothetical protein ACJIWE_000718 [Enterobacter roggenkampii]
MSVKRYSVGVDGVDPNGNLVKYTDYAALEARCLELAAENAGLKESRKNLAEFIHEELDADYPLNMDIETPVTDVFLAEVRASGVDALVERRLTAARLAKEAGHEITARDLEGEAIRARVFAMELRKGVQS